jgi:hypothetical protein
MIKSSFCVYLFGLEAFAPKQGLSFWVSIGIAETQKPHSANGMRLLFMKIV